MTSLAPSAWFAGLPRPHRLAWFVAGAASWLGAGCAGPPAAAPVAVPAALQPHGEKAAFTLFARGVQIYECKAAAGAAAAWVFVAPEAELFESEAASVRAGTALGSHGAGPFWRAADGSQTVGTVAARADAPAAGHIPWLLLSTRSTGTAGLMADITSVQRIRTHGGVAPAGPCAAATAGSAAQTARVPYTADYVFFVKG